MISIKKLTYVHFSNCFELLSGNKKELIDFNYLGWSFNQLKNQFSKKTNLAIGLYNNTKLQGFVIGDVIFVENIAEYEILLIYVNEYKRNLGYGTILLNNIQLLFKTSKLKKIYLEVSSENKQALTLYEKNGYIKSGIRKKYYKIMNKFEDALLLEKTINDTK